MNRTEWEYMRVWYLTSTEVSRPGQSQTWSQEYWISRPGAEQEQLAAAGVDFDVLLNEFGAEGWELVSENTRDSVVIAEQRGWPNVGTPVSIVWTFKRPNER